MIEDIGQQLQRAREARGLTLEQAAQATHMRLRYLQALESGDLSGIPSMVQARGFLRTYAGFLGMDSQALFDQLNRAEVDDTAQASPSIDDLAAPPVEAGNLTPVSDGIPESIFVDLGNRLQRQRELLGLSLEDVARHTHLRLHYLRSLEGGDLDGLPSPVQGRGMLKNYATFLGLDPEPLLLSFAEGLQARLAQKKAETAIATDVSSRLDGSRVLKNFSGLRRLLSGDMLIGGILVIFLSAFVVWGVVRVYAIRLQQAPAATAPSVAELLAQTVTVTTTPSPTMTPEPALDTPFSGEGTPVIEGESRAGETSQVTLEAAGASVTAGTPQVSGSPVQVYVTVRQRSYMRVTTDGEVQFDGRVIPGSAYQFGGEEQVEILTGNGAGLQIFFNGQDLGPMGLFGQVIQRVFTPQGIETPTPTITPTSTETPRPSPTAAGTPTLQQFITATP